MPWRRIVLWTTLSALLIVIAAVVFLFTADLGFLKPQIEERVTRASGRPFSIGGDLSIRLGRRAIVGAGDVTWQDAAWAAEKEMLRVGRFEIEVDLLSVIRGPFVVERVLVRDARVHLARNADDESNWAMFDTQPAATEPEPDEAHSWMVRQLDVTTVDIRIDRATRPAPLELKVRSLQQSIDDDDIVATSLEAASRDRELSITSRVGTWTSLLEQGRVDYDLDGRLDRVQLTSHGFIDSLAEPRRPSLEFAVKGPAVSDLFVLAGLGEHGAGDIDLRGSLQPRDGGPLKLDVSGNAGETVIDATGTFSDLQTLQRAELSGSASGPNLGRILGLFGIDQVSEVPFALALDVERNGPLVTIRDSSLDVGDAKAALQGQLPEFPSLENGKASVRIEGPAIERLTRLLPIPHALTGPFLVQADLDASQAQGEAFRIDAQTPLGRLEASGPLGPAPEHFGSRVDFRFAGESLAAIASVWDVDGPADVPVAVAGNLELAADGVRLNDVLATLGEHEATLNGVVGRQAGLRGSKLSLQLQGDSLADLAQTVHPLDGLPGEAYIVRADVGIDDAGYGVEGIDAEIGEARLTGDGLISRDREFAGSRVSASLQGPALERLIPALGARRVRPGPFTMSGDVSIAEDTLKVGQFRLEREFASLAADLDLGWPLSFEQAKFDIRGEGENIQALIGEAGHLQLEEQPYAIELRGSRASSTWTIETLDVSLGEARAHASGTVDYGDRIGATHLEISGAIPSVASLGTFNGRRLRDRSVELAATLLGREDEIAVDDLNLTIDEGTIGGNIKFSPGAVPHLNVDLHSGYLALHPLTEGPESGPPVEKSPDGRLIPDLSVNLDALASLDGSVRLQVADLHRNDLHLRNLGVEAALRGGILEVSRFVFDGKTGRLEATASAGAGQFAISLTTRDFAFGLNAESPDHLMTVNVDSKLRSSGNDLRAIAANMNGFMLVNSGGGRMRPSPLLQALYGNLFDEILSAINPFHKAGEFTTFECVILPLNFVNGRVTTAPNYLVLTDKVQMVSQATFNLHDEVIDMSVHTLPRKSVGISAAEIVNPYVKIVGTFAAPRLGLDQKGALVAGGAAVATGGLSILAKATWERLSKEKNPCQAAADQAKALFKEQIG